MSERRLKKHHLGLAVLIALQAYLTLSAFGSIEDLMSPDPVLNVDWCSQYYWSHAARSLHKVSGRIWGFDPYYMAGYPLDFVFNSSLPVQLTSLLLNFLSTGSAIKIFYIVTFLLVPVFLYLSMKNFGLSPLAALATASLGTVYFWLAEDALFGQWGMLSGSFILNFFLFPTSLLFRWMENGSRGALFWLFIALPAGILIHKTALVLIPVPFLVMLIAFRRKLDARIIFIIFVLALWTFLVNAFWLLPFFHFLPLKIEDPVTTFFQNPDPWRFIKDLTPFQEYFAIPLYRLFILGFAALGAFSLRRSEEGREGFRFLVTAIGVFFLLTYFGYFIEPLRHIQPYRYVTGLYFLLLVPCGYGLVRAYRWKGRISAAVFIVLLIVPMALPIPSWRYFSAVSPLRTSFPPEVEGLLEWIENNTDRSARIMIEDNNAWEDKSPAYGATRFPGMLPALVPRECVGGPLPNAFIKHHHVHFHDGRFLGKRIEECSDDWLMERVRLYNIKWAVCWSDASKNRLGEMSEFAKEKAGFGRIAVFEFNNEPDFFIRGRGKIRADYDRIELTGIKPDDNTVIIKYHYMEEFKAEPDAGIFRVDVPGDPIGFIGLRGPASEVTLHFAP